MQAVPIMYSSEKCVDCRGCEQICAFTHYGLHNRHKSGIKISPRWPDPTVAAVCRHCEEPACAESCPTEALTLSDEGVVRFSAESCIDCGACVEACPFEAIWRDPVTAWMIKCDTCDGAYRCVEWCPVGALAAKAVEA